MSDRKASKLGSFLDFLSGVPVFTDPVMTGVIANIAFDVVSEAFKKLKVPFEEQDNIYGRAKAASSHLTEAGEILTELQSEINQRNSDLEKLLSDIDARHAEADRLGRIADMKQEEVDAITTEVENRIREELGRNKTRRRVLSCVVWAITLFAGGIVGFLVQKWLGSS